ncbi:MAG: hypothetical protein K2P59_04190, partial [Acetatifactor sp.]|nr:hypothetical protein [Acetatifactor sp.]
MEVAGRRSGGIDSAEAPTPGETTGNDNAEAPTSGEEAGNDNAESPTARETVGNGNTGARIVREAGEDDTGAADGERLGLLLREDEQIRVEYDWSKSLEAPVKQGTMVGSIRYIVDGRVYLTENIVTTQNVE